MGEEDWAVKPSWQELVAEQQRQRELVAEENDRRLLRARLMKEQEKS